MHDELIKLWDEIHVTNNTTLFQFLFLVVNEDYTLPNTSFTLFREPIPISITLEKDGVAGEGLETITLTLIQTFGTEDDRIILEYRTVVINLQDIDGRAICHQNPTNISGNVLYINWGYSQHSHKTMQAFTVIQIELNISCVLRYGWY